jgi:predicted O-methyltransferase YrrM
MKLAEDYISEVSSEPDDALKWLIRQTNIRTNHSRMLSGQILGKTLEMISYMVAPVNILEIGTFTGYSAICLSKGLTSEGHLDTIEINDELEDLIKEAFEKAKVSGRISLHHGDASKIIPELDKVYDLVYIDANKREYCKYFELVIDKVRPGGFILADNVLWDGKVLLEPMPSDAQTIEIARFNEMIKKDHRVENVLIPIRDGLNIIRKL